MENVLTFVGLALAIGVGELIARLGLAGVMTLSMRRRYRKQQTQAVSGQELDELLAQFRQQNIPTDDVAAADG